MSAKTDLRRRLWKREDENCWYCGRHTTLVCGNNRLDRATNDHLIPRCRGGMNDETNLVSCCRRCNEAKGTLTEAEFRAMTAVDAIRFNDAVQKYGIKNIHIVEICLGASAGYRKAIAA